MTAASQAGVWAAARPLPGYSNLNHHGGGGLYISLSCDSATNCAAGGVYAGASGSFQAFVANRISGTWHTATEVPGSMTLNKGNASISQVRCASAGNCTAVGQYTGQSGNSQPLVVSEVNGTWGAAIELPGIGALNNSAGASLTTVSCASPGNCTAAGVYKDSSQHAQVLVASQVNGAWRRAVALPGITTLNKDGLAWSGGVSCASAGNCTVGGSYFDASAQMQAFIDSQVNGTWQTAIEVPGNATLNQGGRAGINTASCPIAGNCTAIGWYRDESHHQQVFTISEVDGAWHAAAEVPGTAALNQGHTAEMPGLSCASIGNCAAAGYYTDSSGNTQAMVAEEINGTWHNATELPGIAAVNLGGRSYISAMSCPSAGNCSAGGWYTASTGHTRPLLASEVDGTWRPAIQAPGVTALDHGFGAQIDSISCTAPGICTAGGEYTLSTGTTEEFTASQS